MTHTKGPWEAIKGRNQWGVVAHPLPRGGTRRRIAVCGSSRAYKDAELDAQDFANARLIAAAPDLLAALVKMHDMCRTHPALQARDYIDLGIEVNAAIDRATSQTREDA